MACKKRAREAGAARGGGSNWAATRHLSRGHSCAVKKLTLREVEEATGREVLERLPLPARKRPDHAAFAERAPRACTRLRRSVTEMLTEKAGYISPVQPATASVLRSGSRQQPTSALASQNITKAEEEQLLEYLAFLRSRRHGKR